MRMWFTLDDKSGYFGSNIIEEDYYYVYIPLYLHNVTLTKKKLNILDIVPRYTTMFLCIVPWYYYGLFWSSM